MSEETYFEKVKKKERKLTDAVVELMERSGFEIDRVAIEDNNKGPDISASYENGDVICEIKAFHKKKGSLHSAFNQVKRYSEGNEELWVVTTSDVEPLYVPNDIHLFLGKDILSKLNKRSLDTWGVEWVREAEVKKEPIEFEVIEDLDSSKESRSREFLTAKEIGSLNKGDRSPLARDKLAKKIVMAIKRGKRTLPSISEEIEVKNQIIESKLKFLLENDVIREK